MIRLTSDTHFGHGKLAELRGFSSVGEHDLTITRNLARGADETTETVFAGDFALGDWRYALGWLAAIPGRKHLVLGNHDRAHPMMSNGHRYLRDYLEFFSTVTTSLRLRWEGREVLVSHFPYEGEGDRPGPDRATQWRLRDEGLLLLHGHTHGGPESRLTRTAAGTPQYHIGLDAHGLRPVTLGEAITEAEALNGAR